MKTAAPATRRARGRIQSVWVVVRDPLDGELDSICRERCIGSAVDGLGRLLSLEEALFAIAELLILEVEDVPRIGAEAHEDSFFRVCRGLVADFPRRYAAYRKLRSDGWVVRLNALKFAADFMLYDGTPDEVHAHYAVIIASPSLRWREVLKGSRLAGSVAKDLLVVVFTGSCAAGGPHADTGEPQAAGAMVDEHPAQGMETSSVDTSSTLREFLSSPEAEAELVAIKRWTPHLT